MSTKIKAPVRTITGDYWMLDIVIDEDIPDWYSPRFYSRLDGEPQYIPPHRVKFDGELELCSG